MIRTSQMANRAGNSRSSALGIPKMNRNARRMNAFNQQKATDRNDWADEVYAEQYPQEYPDRVRRGKPTPRTKAFREKAKLATAKPPVISDPAEVTPGLVKAKTETLKDEPLWTEGPYTGTQPITRIYSHNIDFSTFPLLLERVYADLEAENPRLRRELPFCAFQHVYTSLLNAKIIDHVRTINAEDRYADEESPLNLIPEDMTIPAPIAEYFKMVANTTTPSGELVKVNIPDIGIPQVFIPEDGDKREIPSGSFGRILPEDHNKYECYVSPYITSRLVLQTRRQAMGQWNPLPVGAYPDASVPNTNLLGYREPERLNPEGVQSISGFDFPDSDDMAGRLCWSPELVARVSGHLGKMSEKYKMFVGRPQHGTNSSIVGFTEVTSAGNSQRLSAINAPVKSCVALGSNQCNMVGLFGLKRCRNGNARGLCYTINGGVPHGWGASINSNFSMIRAFRPVIGVDLPSLRLDKHENASPSGDRSLAITSWTRRNFIIKR